MELLKNLIFRACKQQSIIYYQDIISISMQLYISKGYLKFFVKRQLAWKDIELKFA